MSGVAKFHRRSGQRKEIAYTISAAAAQNISMVLHSEERRVLNQAREELRRTKVGFTG